MAIAANNTGAGPANGAANVTDTSTPAVTTVSGSLCLILSSFYNTGGSAVAGSDSKTNTYTTQRANLGGSGAPGAQIDKNQAGTRGSSHTFSTNGPGNGEFNGVKFIEITGYDTTTPFQSNGEGDGNGATGSMSITSTGTPTGTFMSVAVFTVDTGASSTFTDPSGWTKFGEITDGTAELVGVCYYKVHTNPGAAVTCAPTWNGSITAWRGTMVAVNEAAAAGPTPGAIATPVVLPAPTIISSPTVTPGVLATPVALPAVVAGALVTATPPVIATPAVLPGIRLTAATTVVGYVKEVGSNANNTAATTVAITVATGGVPANDVITVIGALDNTGASGAVQTITVADNSSQAGTANTYTVQTPHGIADPGAASAGQEGFMAVCVVTRPLLAGDTITVTFANSTTAKACRADQWHGVNRTTPILSGTYAHTDNQTGTAVTVSSTPTAAGQAFVGGCAVEGGTADSFTQDSDTTNGSWVTLPRIGAGTTTSGSTLNSVYKVVTASGAQTWNPTLGTARDSTSMSLVLDVISVTDVLIQMGLVATPSVLPAPTISVPPPSPTPGVIATPVVLPAPTITATATVTPAVLATPVVLPALTVVIAATPPVLATPVTLPAPSLIVSPTATPAVIATPVVLPSIVPPVKVPTSISGRHLLDQNGDPIFIKTFSSWGINQLLSNANITAALEDVAAGGFNSITATFGGPQLDGGDTTGWHRHKNQAGQDFWTGTPWASSLGAAWGSVDWMLDEAARLGLFVNFSLFAGFDGSEGDGLAWEAVTNTDMYNAAVAICTRYANVRNIVWHVELDSSHDPATTRGARVEAFFDGVNDTESPARVVRWMESLKDGGTTHTQDEQGWDLNTGQFAPSVTTGYSYTANGTTEAELWRSATSGPFMDAEAPYDGAGWVSAQALRGRTYCLIIEGGSGINNSHEQWWPFTATGLFSGDISGGDWTDVFAHSHVIQMGWAWNILDRYAKDLTWVNSAFVTGGEGTGSSKAASGNGDRSALAYFPNSRGSITVDTTLIAGSNPVMLRWYDPTLDPASSSSYTIIAAAEAQNGSRSVTHPGNNSVGDGDWVLIVEALPALTVLATPVALPAPTITGGTTNVSAPLIATPAVLPAVTVTASGTPTPPVLSTPVALPAPTVSISRTATPAVLATPVALPAVTVTASATVTPAIVPTPVALPAPSITASATVTPAVLPTPVALPAATVTASVTVSPAIVATPVALPAPTVTVSRTATPAVIATPVVLPAPAITAGGSSTAQGPLVATPVALPAPSISAGATIFPSVLATPAALPAPSISTGSGQTVAGPLLATPAALPAVTVSISVTAAPATIPTPCILPAPTVSTNSSQTATPATVPTPVTLPALAISAGVTITAPLIATPVALPGPGVFLLLPVFWGPRRTVKLDPPRRTIRIDGPRRTRRIL